MTVTISETFFTDSGPVDGAIVYAYLATRFNTVPELGAAPPAGAPDAGPVLTGTQFGGPGQFQIDVAVDANYYVMIQYNNVNYWQLVQPVDAGGSGSGGGGTDNDPYIPLSQMGVPGGVATLGVDGILTPTQWPPPSGAVVPTITSFTPTSGTTLGGTVVTITGTNLQTATAVAFGPIAGTNVSASLDGTTVTVTTPAEGAGAVPVTVTTAIGNPQAPQAYTFVAPAPVTITSFTPVSGSTAGGTQVTITGTNLQGATSVQFGSHNGPVDSNPNSTTVLATTNPQPAGFVNIIVTTPQGQATSPTQYQFIAAPPPTPTITSFTPAYGTTAGGTTVTITGTNIGAATSVLFGSTAATIVSNSATQIVCTTPAESAAGVTISVTTSGGTATSGTNFTFQAPATITSFTPSNGPIAGGTTVTITGTQFLPNSITPVVKFGTVAASVTSYTSTSIVCVTPPEAAGAVNVSVTTPVNTVVAGSQYTFTTPAPTITSYTPITGDTAGGTPVTITGTNLTGGTVLFGTASATIVSTAATTIVCNTPAGTVGAVNVKVTTAGGSATAGTQFTYTGSTGSPTRVMLVALENNGQSSIQPGDSSGQGQLMTKYTYAGGMSIGHLSAPSYVGYFSGIDSHNPGFPPNPYNSTPPNNNPDYSSNAINDFPSDTGIATFNARTTIFDVVYAASKTPYLYYDAGGTTHHRDAALMFPRIVTAGGANGLNGSGVPIGSRTAAGGAAPGALATLITAHLDGDNPDFVYVLPTDTNNGHSSIGQQTTFLNSFVPAVQATNWYKNGGTILFVTDEDQNYGGDSTTATWLPFPSALAYDNREGGSGGFVWIISVSAQTTVTGGANLTSGANYTGGPGWTAGRQAGVSNAGIVATICTALGIDDTGLSTANYAHEFSGLILPPTGGGPPPGGPPPQPSGNQTVNVDGTNIIFVPQWSDAFPGATLSSKWFQFNSATPGAGAKDSGGVPIATWPGNLAVVNNGLLLQAKIGPNNSNGNPTLQSGGIGTTSAFNLTPNAMVDWAMQINQNVGQHLITYCIWFPPTPAFTWPKNQEYDIYENDGTGNVTHLTVHGSHSGQNDNVSAGGVQSTHNYNQWTYCRAIWTAGTIQLWAGASANSLTLQAEVTATTISNAGIVAPAGGAIDANPHAWNLVLLLEQPATTIPTGFSSTPSTVATIAWVVGYHG